MRRKFEIPMRLPDLNAYTRELSRNRYAGAKLKGETEDAIIWAIKRAKPEPIQGPAIFHFTWYERNRRRDKDNVAFAKKFIFDALQKAGILPDDDNRYVKGFTDTFVYGKKEGVTVEIEDAE